jgi:hypothetical protein
VHFSTADFSSSRIFSLALKNVLAFWHTAGTMTQHTTLSDLRTLDPGCVALVLAQREQLLSRDTEIERLT